MPKVVRQVVTVSFDVEVEATEYNGEYEDIDWDQPHQNQIIRMIYNEIDDDNWEDVEL